MNAGAPRSRLAVTLAAAAGLTAWGGARAIPKDADSWIRIDSEHFSVLSDASLRQTRAIVGQLEGFRTVLGMVTSGISLTSPVPVSVLLFKNETAFDPYRGGPPGEKGVTTVGYFARGRERNFLVINAGAAIGREGFDVVYHEYVHEVLSHNLVNPPVWLDEGLAEYFGTFWSNGDRAEIGRPPRARIESMRVILPMPLTELLRVHRDSPEYRARDLKQAFYAESWALVHYLLMGNVSRREQIQDLVKRLRAGEPSEKAVQEAFGADLTPLEQELATYIRQGSYRFHIYRLKNADLPDIPEPSPASRLEVIGTLGHLLIHLVSGSANAEAHFRAVLEAAPSDARALAGLAFLADAAGRRDEARDLYSKALASAPDDPEVLFLAAQSLLQVPGHRGSFSNPMPPGVLAARDLLQRSLLAAPNNPEAFAALGMTYVGESGDLSVGIASLERALPSLPDRADVAGNLILLYAQTGDRDAATKLLEGRLRTVGSRGQIEVVEDAILEIDLKAADTAASTGDIEKAISILRGIDGRFHDPVRAARVSRSLRRLQTRSAQRDAYNAAGRLYDAGDFGGAVKGFEALAAGCGDDRRFCDAVNTALEDARTRAARAAQGKAKPH